jgi:hypothetical protein
MLYLKLKINGKIWQQKNFGPKLTRRRYGQVYNTLTGKIMASHEDLRLCYGRNSPTD